MTELTGLQVQETVNAQVMPECDANTPGNSFPIFSESLSYEQLAQELSKFFGKPVSKHTLKNNWFSSGGRIDRIYQGLELPSPLKSGSGRITPFGIAAVFEFVTLVHFGSKPYDDYVFSVRSHYREQQITVAPCGDLDNLHPATSSIPPTSSRLNLPAIHPVSSAIKLLSI